MTITKSLSRIPEVRLSVGDQFRLGDHVCIMRNVGLSGGIAWSPALGEFQHSLYVDKKSYIGSSKK